MKFIPFEHCYFIVISRIWRLWWIRWWPSSWRITWRIWWYENNYIVCVACSRLVCCLQCLIEKFNITHFFYDNPNESETIKFNIQLIVFQAMAVMETTIIMADMEVSNK